MRRKHKTLMYLALGAAAWWYYQKQRGNNFLGQPAAVTTASLTNAGNATNAAVAAIPVATVTG
jgi:hypothetical protein